LNDISKYINISKNSEGEYFIEIITNNFYINNDQNIADIINISFEKYINLSRKFNSKLYGGFIYFDKKYNCQNFVKYLIKNYENDIINSLIINTLNEKK
jgi:hypothetical protein